MARKYLASDKRGVVSDRKISGKNLRASYVKVGKSKGRNVYAKHGFEDKVRGSRKHPISFFEAKPRIIGGPHPPIGAKKVEVTGLVGVYYDGDFFHAELLFKWYGKETFDTEVLLDEAVQILLSELPNIERISYELVASPLMHEDIRVRGIGEVIRYDGQRVNEMDYQIFIPKAGSRCLWAGSTRVDA